MTSRYSQEWFDTFGGQVDPSQTDREVEFVLRRLVNRKAPSCVLDVCCGTARHARRLAKAGCEVTGVEIERSVVEEVRRADTPGFTILQGDMRELPALLKNGARSFDCILCLWQSFGQFSDEENSRVLRDFAGLLANDGILVMDVYNPEFHKRHLGKRTFVRNAREVTEAKEFKGRRLTVDLDYGDGIRDHFDWRLYSPKEWNALAHECNLELILECTQFDEASAPTPDEPRMQLVLVPLNSRDRT